MMMMLLWVALWLVVLYGVFAIVRALVQLANAATRIAAALERAAERDTLPR